MYIGYKIYKPVEDWKHYAEVAEWCNNNNATIEDKPDYYEVIEIPKPVVTKQDLNKFTYDEKCRVAYTGISIVTNDITYLFETDKDSITMCNSQTNAFMIDETLTSVDWKVYKDNSPTIITLTKQQFVRILSFGMQVINTCFALEGTLNNTIESMTDEQLKDDEFINNFKTDAIAQFNAINKQVIIEENGEVTV